MRYAALITPILLSLSNIVCSQTQLPEPKRAFHDSDHEGRDYFVVFGKAGNDTVFTENLTTGDAEVRVVIEFIDEPAAQMATQHKTSGRSRVLSAKNQIQTRIRQLQHDLKQISSRYRSVHGRKTSSAVINRSYHKVFSGAQLNISRDMEKEIKALNYVKKIYPDRQVKITLDESVSMINADKIHQDYGVYGEGIKVGIIDTGIDYNHPDLGGGIGEGYKVAGGYDFVNGDNDPMDDHSHGTHVAGIVAADGETFKGVAPKAKLYALKALGASGSGFTSDIIAAVEWSVDPNNDGDISDRLDVVNMSLGGSGNSNSPMSVAVDNAVNMGVTFCVAAGNNAKYYSIASPGNARNAITVGSVDKSGGVSSFSSRGPTPEYMLNKPDIMAPGAGIYATIPGGSYGYKSGTSMASPHVAGAVALLLNLYPDWIPYTIKSALMQTASHIDGFSLHDQGKGIIDLNALVNAKTLTSPNSISFGDIPISEDVWHTSDTIFIKNRSDAAEVYSITHVDSEGTGVGVQFEKQNLSLLPGESGYFQFTITIELAAIPEPQLYPLNQGGKFIITSQTANYDVPYSFYTGNRINIDFNIPPSVMIIHNQIDQSHWFSGLDSKLNLPFTRGSYDMMAVYHNYEGMNIVVKENVVIDGNVTLEINNTDAIHEVTYQIKDTDGNLAGIRNEGTSRFIHKKSGFGFISYRGTNATDLPPTSVKSYFSAISDQYQFQTSVTSRPSWNNNSHFYNLPIAVSNGIDTSFTYSNDPSEFTKITIDIPLPQQEDKLYYTKDFFTPGRSYSYGIFDSLMILNYPYQIEEYILPLPHKDHLVNRMVRNNVYRYNKETNKFDSYRDSLLLTTASIEMPSNKDSINYFKKVSEDWTKSVHLVSEGNARNPVFNGPANFTNQATTDYHSIILNDEMQFFYDSHNNLKHQKVAYRLTDGVDNVINEGHFSNKPVSFGSNPQPIHLPLKAGTHHKLYFSFDGYRVANQTSLSTVVYEFFSAPTSFAQIHLLNLMNPKGTITNEFMEGEKIDILFNTNTALASEPVKLYVKNENEPDWTEIAVENLEKYDKVVRKKSTIIDSLDPGYYSLKFSLSEGAEKFCYLAEPAFHVTSAYQIDSLALAAFYASTNGDDWNQNNGWLKSSDLNDWLGVSVENGRVSGLHLEGNNLSGKIPNSFTNLSQLKNVNLSNNNIESLTDLSALEHLESLDVSNNKLKIGHLLPNLFIKNFSYAPQDSIGTTTFQFKSPGDTHSFFVDENAPGNVYTWLKNGKVISDTENSAFYHIKSFSPADIGIYHCIITNSSLPNLQLASKAQLVFLKDNDHVQNNGFITGIKKENTQMGVTIYPNPSDGFITLETTQNRLPKFEVEIFNSLGAQVFQKKVNRTTHKMPTQIQINELRPGIYIAKILVNDEILTKKIIVK